MTPQSYELALSTFLASVSSNLLLQNDLIRNCPTLLDDLFNSYLFRWTTSFQPLLPPVSTAACKQSFWDTPLVESLFAILLASQPDEHNQVDGYLLLQLHTVVTGYIYYRFHPVDYVLTKTLLESLSVLGLARTYVILISALVSLPLTVVAHMVYLASEVRANWSDIKLSII